MRCCFQVFRCAAIVSHGSSSLVSEKEAVGKKGLMAFQAGSMIV